MSHPDTHTVDGHYRGCSTNVCYCPDTKRANWNQVNHVINNDIIERTQQLVARADAITAAIVARTENPTSAARLDEELKHIAKERALLAAALERDDLTETFEVKDGKVRRVTENGVSEWRDLPAGPHKVKLEKDAVEVEIALTAAIDNLKKKRQFWLASPRDAHARRSFNDAVKEFIKVYDVDPTPLLEG